MIFEFLICDISPRLSDEGDIHSKSNKFLPVICPFENADILTSFLVKMENKSNKYPGALLHLYLNICSFTIFPKCEGVFTYSKIRLVVVRKTLEVPRPFYCA